MLARQAAHEHGAPHVLGLAAFGPTNVGAWRMSVSLEARDYAHAVGVAEGLRPELLPSAGRRANYWAEYGRALARVRGRQDDAVKALRKADCSRQHGCNVTRSSARCSRSCWCAHAGTRWVESCGGWPTGLICRYNRPSGGPFRRCNTRLCRSFTLINRDQHHHGRPSVALPAANAGGAVAADHTFGCGLGFSGNPHEKRPNHG